MNFVISHSPEHNHNSDTNEKIENSDKYIAAQLFRFPTLRDQFFLLFLVNKVMYLGISSLSLKTKIIEHIF